MRKKSIALAALAVAGTVTLAACGSGNDGGSDNSMNGMSGMSSSSTTPSASSSSSDQMSDFNEADVTFATDMIPHHRQAVEMAKLADTRAQSPKVKDLAMQIMKAQGPEIQTMSGWLTSWGKPVPQDMGGMDMSGSMPGMMSSADVSKLKKASGADFDRMFLTMMIAHHQGAIQMAKTEESSGMNTDAVALAKQIETAQAAEIKTMRVLLK